MRKLRHFPAHAPALGPCCAVGGDFDYTFTEAELHDVLGYMEAQQSGGLVEPLPFYSTALQFQVGTATRWHVHWSAGLPE